MKTTDTALLKNKVFLTQPEQGFRTGLDSVLVAAAVPLGYQNRKNRIRKSIPKILDMGCGAGAITFCLHHRLRNLDHHITGVDYQKDYIELAESNIQPNAANGNVRFIHSDIFKYTVENADNRFDYIVTNPPYLEKQRHIASPVDGKKQAIAYDDAQTSLDDWIYKARDLLKSGGTFTIVHRADHTDQIIRALGGSFGEIEIIPLWPKKDVDAKRVIIRAVKDRRGVCRMHRGIVLHEPDGEYTDTCKAIIHDGQPLI